MAVEDSDGARTDGHVTTQCPPVPETLEQAGVPAATVEQLVLKLLYTRGEMVGRELAAAVGLKFSLIEPMVENLKRQYLIQVRKSLGMGNISAVWSLSDNGRQIAREHMLASQYAGPAPVPLEVYIEWVHRQKRQPGWLTKHQLTRAYRHMVLKPEILARIGPAVNSSSTFLIYGQPGNGKTYLAEALADITEDHVYIPFAVECNGAIIQVFDPVYHKPVSDSFADSIVLMDAGFDRRFIKCRRPFIVTGGELTMSMLDLSYNESAKFYDAPLQMKANNGIYLLDDFGRQLATPAEILNRWIVPMERRVDYLNLNNGGKVTVPFESFLVFSTNLRPEQLGDEAFLRRIRYKMLVRSPDSEEFLTIFEAQCSKAGLEYDSGLLRTFIEHHYTRTGKMFRRCQPRDLVSHALDLIRFENRPALLTLDVLQTAFASCFAEECE